MLLSRKQVFPSSAKDQKFLIYLMNVHHPPHRSLPFYFRLPISAWRCHLPSYLLSVACPVLDGTSAAKSLDWIERLLLGLLKRHTLALLLFSPPLHPFHIEAFFIQVDENMFLEVDGIVGIYSTQRG